ncbi:hypothetical protein H696_05822 [Fonticula alba]|uniref:Phosphatidylinositol N-acetylglucosaminyltransferase subunit H conserved domain-containing protein n=1 Tax=Fonticula alba TaxID=691883 RepID=A0A058Z0B4_FONAL|nr:hypothetical protein H696_05822 [Fonticula alba]KCV67714.1 hypothetical protein H696_05822 [Fonticula alba]|eukprot:XP_009497898.1 hypothetical protein H696_05822 [Fonticula alba]
MAPGAALLAWSRPGQLPDLARTLVTLSMAGLVAALAGLIAWDWRHPIFKESLHVSRDVGLILTADRRRLYSLLAGASRQQRFLPRSSVVDLLVNEGLFRGRVVFYASVVTSDEGNSAGRRPANGSAAILAQSLGATTTAGAPPGHQLVPLFTRSLPRLESLTRIVYPMREVLFEDPAPGPGGLPHFPPQPGPAGATPHRTPAGTGGAAWSDVRQRPAQRRMVTT